MAETWFDTRTGDVLVGEAAAGARIDEAGPDIVPLPELLTAEEFPYTHGDFGKVHHEDFSTEDYLMVGRWALSLVQQERGEQQPLTTTHVRRLNALGLMPTMHFIGKQFGSFSEFKGQIGSPIHYDRVRYTDWGVADFVEYARGRIDHLGRLPTMYEYQQWFEEGNGPSFRLIEDRVGGIKPLHDLLGYPDTSEWEEEDFTDWGVRVMRANQGHISLPIVVVLSRHRRGPSAWTIGRSCDGWASFRRRTVAAYTEELQQEAEKLADYEQLLATGRLPREFRAVLTRQLPAVVGRYLVLCDCVPNMAPAQKVSLSLGPSSRLIVGIRRYAKEITPGYIEMVASSKGVFDDIWPHDESYLRVSEEEYDQERLRVNAVRRRERLNRRRRQRLKAS